MRNTRGIGSEGRITIKRKMAAVVVIQAQAAGMSLLLLLLLLFRCYWCCVFMCLLFRPAVL